MTKLDNSHITKVLGQTVDYPDQYDSSILVREPRSNNRQHLSIDDDALPFVGYDTWNAYEASTLTTNGLPVTGVIKIVYPCSSKYIVESKSIKLYLNSFNMFKSGSTRNDAIKFMIDNVKNDLSKLLETNVSAAFIESINSSPKPIFEKYGYETLEYTLVPSTIINDIEFNLYEETPELLKYTPGLEKVQNIHSGLLKSNCRVTSQPDWGDIYIHICGSRQITYESLLRYIISFRNENHFHEEICETVYKRLNDLLEPSELCVTCLYARRGGIDINPVRASAEDIISEILINPDEEHYKTQKQ